MLNFSPENPGHKTQPGRQMYLVWVFLFSLYFPQFSIAINTDSLNRKLSVSQGADRLHLLNMLAGEFSEEHPDKALNYATEALQLARKEKNPSEEASALQNLADAAYFLNNFREAIKYYLQSANILEKVSGEKSGDYIECIGNIGFTYQKMNLNEQALEYFNRALVLAEKSGNKDEMASNNNNIGTIYAEWGDYGKAVEYFQKSMKLDLLSEKKEYVSTDMNNIGKIYELWGKFDQAVQYYLEALELDKKAGNKSKIAIRLNNIGTAYKAWGKYKEALDYFSQALEIERLMGNTENVGRRLTHIGNTYFSMAQFETAYSYYIQALSIFTRTESSSDLARLYYSFGNYYLAKNDRKQAIENFTKSLDLAQKNNLKPLVYSNFEALSKVYARNGNFEEALGAYKSFVSLKDSVFSQESDKKLSEFRARFEFEKIQHENDLLKKDKSIQQKTQVILGITLATAVLIFISVAFILRLRTKNSKQAKELAERNAEKYRKDLELKNQELAYNAMCIIRNNEAIARMTENVQRMAATESSPERLKAILDNIRTMEHDQSYKEFEVRFTQVHQDFYDRLNQSFPDLTPNEKKLCAFLRLNMTTKDIASITHQSVHSINVARTRLRKRLNLSNKEDNLVNYMMNF